MKADRFTFFGRARSFCPSAALMFTMLVLMVAATVAAAQTTVFVAGNATGGFGNGVDIVVPLVPAITVDGPATITVIYVSGMVWWGGGSVGPNGGQIWNSGWQTPLQEANGVASGTIYDGAALIGAFVPKYRVNDRRGFKAIDGTKNLARVGIEPHLLRFIGESRTLNVHEAGTLFLGINDDYVGDNGGGFTVTVTATAP